MDRNLIAAIMRNTDGVALRKESVDRNGLVLILPAVMAGRSPQGERG